MKSDDRNAILARVEIVAGVLGLRDEEVDAAMADDEAVIDFAIRHGQSIDWLVLGDVRMMIAKRAAERA